MKVYGISGSIPFLLECQNLSGDLQDSVPLPTFKLGGIAQPVTQISCGVYRALAATTGLKRGATEWIAEMTTDIHMVLKGEVVLK